MFNLKYKAMSKNSVKKPDVVKDFENILHDIEVCTARLLVLQNQLEVFIMANSLVRCSCQVMRDGQVQFILSNAYKGYAQYDKLPLYVLIKAIKEYGKLSLLAREGVSDE